MNGSMRYFLTLDDAYVRRRAFIEWAVGRGYGCHEEWDDWFATHECASLWKAYRAGFDAATGCLKTETDYAMINRIARGDE